MSPVQPFVIPSGVVAPGALSAIIGNFTASSVVARYAVGPEAVSSGAAQRAIDGSSSLRPPIKQFVVADKKLGIIQFGPTPQPRRGLVEYPVDAIAKALGVPRLPEPVTVLGHLPFEQKTYPRTLVQFFSALKTMGANLSSGIGKEEKQYAAKHGHVSTNLTASLAGENVRLKFAIGTRFDKRGLMQSDFELTSLPLSDGCIILSAALLHDVHQNSPDGFEALGRGLVRLLEPFVEPDAPLTLRPRDESGDPGVFYLRKFIANVSPVSKDDAIKQMGVTRLKGMLDENGRLLAGDS